MSIFNFGKKKKQEGRKAPERKENPNNLGLLEFTVNGNHCAVKAESVREITQYQALTPSGLKHPSIEGVFLFNNRPVTVIDLKKYMGISGSEPSGCFIIVNTHGRDSAIHVDDIVGVNSVDKGLVLKPENSPRAIVGAVKIEGRPAAIFSFDIILADVFSIDDTDENL